MFDIEDVEMIESENPKIMETPHSIINSSRVSNCTFNSIDSGYLSTTPHSFVYTPSTTSCRSINTFSSSPKRHYWLRQTERHRSKNLSTLINASVENDSFMDNSCEIVNNCHKNNKNNKNIKVKSPDNDILMNRYEFRMELREHRNRSRRNQRTASAITPASSINRHNIHKHKSPVTSSAIPSASFVAFEPIETSNKIEDVKEKLVINSQNISYTTTPSTKINFTTTIPTIEITSSPTTRKTSPFNKNLNSSWNKKLSKLNINDHSDVDIKPKRLDFDRTNFTKRRRISNYISFIGKKKIDIFSLLGEQTNHCWIVSKILGYLSSQDLCSISMVSTIWRRICYADNAANQRRIQLMHQRRFNKENFGLNKKFKIEVNVEQSSERRTLRYLVPIDNLMVPKGKRPPRSPPVSPSKIKFHSFVKAGRSLEPWERLFSCPTCSFASHVDNEKNVGTCTREGCGMKFCTFCSSKPHSGPCKTPLLATPTKRRTPPVIVGSKQSKRNLRRL